MQLLMAMAGTVHTAWRAAGREAGARIMPIAKILPPTEILRRIVSS